MAFNKQQDKLDFKQIVLSHLKKILEISTHELRDSTSIIIQGNFNQTSFQEDTRYAYIQSIENLAYVLFPYFDEKNNRSL